MARFTVIGLDHQHVCDVTEGLLAAGAACIFHVPVTPDPRVLAGFRSRFPNVSAGDRQALRTIR